MQTYETLKRIFDSETLPVAFVDIDALERNAQEILRLAGTLPVRVVSKSIRSVGLIKYILSLSNRFNGVMCFHPAEAAYMAQQGVSDILVAYPSMQRADIEKACSASAAGSHVTLMVDCQQHARLINEVASQLGVVQPVCMDIDMATPLPGLFFGVRRSPIRTVEDALRLYEVISTYPSIKLTSVMGYEAQIAGVADSIPGRYLENSVIPMLKKIAIPGVKKRRGQIVAALQAAGASLETVNGGGTGSISSTAADASVTEVAVGSGFFCPKLFSFYNSLALEPAAGFVLEVARSSDAGYVTCSGGGYIASGSSGDEKQPEPYLPEGLKLVKNEGAGEVQTPLHTAKQCTELKPGAPVIFRHSKAGELCERFDRLLLIRGSKVENIFTTYRGDGLCYV